MRVLRPWVLVLGLLLPFSSEGFDRPAPVAPRGPTKEKAAPPAPTAGPAGPVAPRNFPNPGSSTPDQGAPEDAVSFVDPSLDAGEGDSADGIDAERPDSERPREELLVQEGGVLLRAGMLQIDPAFDYTHVSGDRFAINGLSIFEAIVIGEVRVDRIDRDIAGLNLTLRYGLHDRLQAEIRVPTLYTREDSVIGVATNDPSRRRTDNVGIGDVEASLLWHALSSESAADVILSLRGRFPTGEDPFEIGTEVVGAGGERRLKRPATGSGFWGVTPGVTAVWRAAPAVLFAGGNYSYNMARTPSGGFGRIDPGDAIELFGGINVGLSERLSMNFSFVDRYTFETRQGGKGTPGSSFNDGRVVIGASLGIDPQRSLLFSAAIGLTAQSPDFQLSVRMPLTLSAPVLRDALHFW